MAQWFNIFKQKVVESVCIMCLTAIWNPSVCSFEGYIILKEAKTTVVCLDMQRSEVLFIPDVVLRCIQVPEPDCIDHHSLWSYL